MSNNRDMLPAVPPTLRALRPSRLAALGLLSLALGLVGCGGGTSEPEVKPPPPAEASDSQPSGPTAESFDKLDATYAPALDTLHRMLDSTEERKGEIVARAREEEERESAELARLDQEIESLARQMSSTAERLAEARQSLAEVRNSSGERAGALLKKEAEELSARLEELGDTREERKQRRAELARTLAGNETLSDDELFVREVQTLYRETVDLQRRYYREGIQLARSKLAGTEANFLVDHYESRIRQRNREMEQGALSEDVVRTFRRQQESDQRMEQALYLAYVLEVRFPTAGHELEDISAVERENLELLSEALRTGWDEWGELQIYIDGHADSRAFRGVRSCESATRNLELSRRRATAVREFLQERLGKSSRFAVDWFGNFALRADAGPAEEDNRRIELRIASAAQETTGVHAAYFRMRGGVELQGRTFVREPGRWVEASCAESEPGERVEYQSREYDELIQRMEFDPETPTSVDLGEGRELLIRLGTHAVVQDGDACVEVVPCTGP